MTAWVGLTGGIGSGKSQVAAYFSLLNIPIIDADKVNSQLINTPNHIALQTIEKTFGQQSINDSGCLNRDYVRQLIFQNPRAKQQLEHILYPFIFAEIQHQQRQQHSVYGVVELPTLHRDSPFLSLINRILVVVCDENERMVRVQKRSQLNLVQIKNIINNQLTDEQRLGFADDVIYNHGSLIQLQAMVHKQHQYYLHIFRQPETNE